MTISVITCDGHRGDELVTISVIMIHVSVEEEE